MMQCEGKIRGGWCDEGVKETGFSLVYEYSYLRPGIDCRTLPSISRKKLPLIICAENRGT